ncbi:MAG: hypothetical protein IPO17_15315 [Flavobacteriales bacterium]|nr:hypothetical protein [Flavobacteriales bacterium]
MTRTAQRWHALGNLADTYLLLKRWEARDSCLRLQWSEMPTSELDGPVFRSSILAELAETALEQKKWDRTVELAYSAVHQVADTTGEGGGARARPPHLRPILEIKATGFSERRSKGRNL